MSIIGDNGVFSNANLSNPSNISNNYISGNVNVEQSGNGALQALRLLPNGTVFEANVSDIKGNNVSLILDNGLTFNASVNTNISYNIGDRVSFMMQDNSSDNIMIKALSVPETNSQNAMIDKSLLAAGLEINDSNRSLVSELIHNNMPINKETITNVAKAMAAFKTGEVQAKDIISLLKIGVKPTHENLTSFNNLKDYNASMQQDVENLAKSLTSSVSDSNSLEKIIDIIFKENSMADSGKTIKTEDEAPENKTQAGNNYQTDSTSKTENTVQTENASRTENTAQTENASKTENAAQTENASETENTAQTENASKTENISQSENTHESESVAKNKVNIQDDNISQSENTVKAENSSQAGNMVKAEKNLVSENSAKNEVFGSDENQKQNNLELELRKIVETLKEFENDPLSALKKKSLDKKEVSRLILQAMRESFSLKYDDITKENAVKEQIAKNLIRLEKLMDFAKQMNNQGLADNINTAKNNIDFLNNVNQYITMAQIPLKHIGGEGKGELYVYRRKKNNDTDNSFKAFLHLDMDNLGPLDIYVTLEGKKVSTNFKVADDGILDFFEKNINVLNEKLQKLGYSTKFSVKLNSDDSGFDIVKETPLMEMPVANISRFRFDIKA